MKEAFKTPYLVAELIAMTPCRDGIPTGVVRSANPRHPESGRKRLREMARRFTLLSGLQAYHYDHGKFYPTAAFKRFCRSEMKRYENN